MEEFTDFIFGFLSTKNQSYNLLMVKTKLMYWLLTDSEGIRKKASTDGVKVIDQIADLYRKRLEGFEPKKEIWIQSENRSADCAASYGYAAAACAAGDAAGAVYYAATAAATAATVFDVDADAAYYSYFSRIADKLMEILQETNLNANKP